MEAVMPKSQPAKAKLSDAQLVILSAGAQRPDGSLLPLPESLAAKGAALNRVMVEILCKRKLAEERATTKGAPEWRRDEDGQPLGLFITKSGLLALDTGDTEKEKPAQAATSTPRQSRARTAKPRGKAPKASAMRSADAVERTKRQRRKKAHQKDRKVKAAKRQTRRKQAVGTRARTKAAAKGQTKQQVCLDLLNRPEGATVEELQTATGWQQHSVRGFLAGAVKKTLGLTLLSQKPAAGPRRYRIANAV
jgi:hypothetical protein